VTTGFRPDLSAQGVDPATCHHVAATEDNRSTCGGFPSLAEAKTGAAINPVPASRLLASGPLGLAFTSVVALPDVPCVQLDN
jgi:hypothetical protein